MGLPPRVHTVRETASRSRSARRSPSRKSSRSSSGSSSSSSSSCDSATDTLNNKDKQLLTIMGEAQLTRRQLLVLAERTPLQDLKVKGAFVLVRATEGCWAAAQILEIETSATYVLKKERRPTKTREYDWKIRAFRGHDEKVIKVGAISNRKMDRDHMRAWKAFVEKSEFGISLPDLEKSKDEVAVVKQQLPSTGTPRSTPRSDPAPPSVEQRCERCDSEPKETPGSGNRSEHSTPAEAAEGQSGSALVSFEDGPEQEPQSALNELSVYEQYEQLLDPESLRRSI
ncbi:Ces2c [Symbiodinium sp. CCMP2592]|nr:Ces2c [Symbiodinium sp. CCMP2592]